MVVADQSHLRKCDAPRGEPRGARENLLGPSQLPRVELGSYRQGDKRFVIKASLSEEEARSTVYQRFNRLTRTPVYVASKVKRSRMAAHRQQQQQHDDDDASVSPMPPALAPARRPPGGAADALSTAGPVAAPGAPRRPRWLQQERVLPILDRLDDRAKTADGA